MLALVYRGAGQLVLERRPYPTLVDAEDAVVRVTRSAICTSDLHILHGAVPRAKEGVVLGHEFVGVVEAVGSAVRTLRPGDRVAANCITFCGRCEFCCRGFVNNCVRGGWELGCRIDGCQAEAVRVPFADEGLKLIPASLDDEAALFVGDILSSGYFGAELAEISPGDIVAVLGAGPVGLCAMQCARLFGAAQVLAIDIDPARLQRALREGLADGAVNPQAQDVFAFVSQRTQGHGADGVIEAAGGADTFETAWRIARPNAAIALVAMYETAQILPLPLMYGKNLKFKTGGVDAVHCARLLRLLAAGKLRTDFLITHRGPLARIAEGYRVFERKEGGCMKWVVTPD